MMKISIFLLVSLTSTYLYAQRDTSTDLAKALAFEIGTNLKDYKDLDRFYLAPQPQLYRFFVKENDSILVASVKFNTITIYTNKDEKIIKIDYSQLYSSPDSNDLTLRLNRNFETISNWVSNFSRAKSKHVSIHLNGSQYSDGTKWRYKKRTIMILKRRRNLRGAEGDFENHLDLTVD